MPLDAHRSLEDLQEQLVRDLDIHVMSVLTIVNVEAQVVIVQKCPSEALAVLQIHAACEDALEVLQPWTRCSCVSTLDYANGW